jgi:phosphoribosyl 1,2-cyclic phosphate phosphodiesterase
MNRIKLLGCGSSLGSPLIGCSCSVCLSKEKRNTRRRCSALLYVNDKVFLIDAGPDIKQQLLEEKVTHIDGLIITHMHYDHVGGMNDLLPLAHFAQSPIPTLCLESTSKLIKKFKAHIIDNFVLHPLKEKEGRVIFGDEPFIYTTYQQDVDVLGIRWGSLAYFTDVKHYDLSLFRSCVGVRQLIISVGSEEEIKGHIGFKKAVEIGRHMEAEELYFTHLSHNIDYNQEKELQERYAVPYGYLAYDQLEILL